MRVRVLLFASLREAAGRDVVELDLPEGAAVEDVLASLRARGDRLAGVLRELRPMAALRERYVEPTAPLAEGDEVALLPPVSGG